jgi:hypothetical protein
MPYARTVLATDLKALPSVRGALPDRERLTRLCEHEAVRNIWSGVYELASEEPPERKG